MDDLALFGGTPAFAEPLHVGRPNIGDRTTLHARLDGIRDRNWLTNNGPFVHSFEEQVRSRMPGAKHCVAMCNATIGLEIAIRALGLEGEVIVPSYTFVATAHSTGRHYPYLFCDIDPSTRHRPKCSRAADNRSHLRNHRRSPLGSALRDRQT